MSKQNRRCIIPADTVGGATDRESIASMWKNHYANLFNCVDTVSDKESVLDTISRVANVHDALCSDDVKSSVKSTFSRMRLSTSEKNKAQAAQMKLKNSKNR